MADCPLHSTIVTVSAKMLANHSRPFILPCKTAIGCLASENCQSLNAAKSLKSSNESPVGAVGALKNSHRCDQNGKGGVRKKNVPRSVRVCYPNAILIFA